jgi:mannose-1-phosphate guanylyltransferase/mannose-6-phosphate isomerase
LSTIGNPGKIPLELIEVQVGSHLAEDDILGLGDVYEDRGYRP